MFILSWRALSFWTYHSFPSYKGTKIKFGPEWGLNPWPLRYRRSNLPTEPISQLGAGHQAVHIYDFHIFMVIYSSPHGLYRTKIMTSSQLACSLPVGLLALLVEHCTGIAEVMDSNPVQAWMFFRPYFDYCSSSVHYCEDHFHIHVFIRSSYL